MLFYTAILLGAGDATRSGLGYNKMFYVIENNKTIIEKSARNFIEDNFCKKILLVCKKDEMDKMKSMFDGKTNKIEYVIGGNSRQESVLNALKVTDSEYVLIHDGARPYYSKELLTRIKMELEKKDAIIPVIPVRDTIKEVKNDVVVRTYNRDDLRIVQTPQGFRTKVILQAHMSNIGGHATDDASLVEKLGNIKVLTVKGEISNSKFTFKEDF